MYKTEDGYELKEGDECFVSVQDPEGIHKLNSNPRPARYMDSIAKVYGWDFHIPHLKGDYPVEVIAVWKNKPKNH